MDNWPEAIKAVAEAVIAVCALYAARRSYHNGQQGEAIKAELEVNPQKTVQEMVRANGPLSGQFPTCQYPPQVMPGESPPRRGV